MPDESFADLVAERVVLRRFRLEDLDAFLTYRSSPEVARFQGWDAPFPVAEAERLIRQMIRDQPDTPGEWCQPRAT